jgi:2-hydroxy-6-oxonona-2,4-dienedioate hydrolase
MSMWTDLLGIPFEVRQVDVKGVSTRAVRAGAGKAVIFLHGMSGHLEAFVPTLPGHVADFEVHLLDMLGHGFTDKPGGAYTVDRLAQHVLDYMDVMGIEKASLVGISLGGWVAAWLLAHHGDRIERSTLVTPGGSPAGISEHYRTRVRTPTIAAVMNEDIADTRRRLELVMGNKEKVTQEIVDIRFRIYHMPDFRAALEDILQLFELDIYPRYVLSAELLGKIQSEVLLAWSEKDVYADVHGAPHFADNIPHNKLVAFRDAGHWLPFERPADFARVNVAFLKGGLGALQEDKV